MEAQYPQADWQARDRARSVLTHRPTVIEGAHLCSMAVLPRHISGQRRFPGSSSLNPDAKQRHTVVCMVDVGVK